jgi:hypothetical protein
MLSFEQEIAQYLENTNFPQENNCASNKLLDFTLYFGKRKFHIDAKEKRQRINTVAWPTVDIPEEWMFIVDDLSARKLILFAPNSGLAIRDNVQGNYYFVNVVDLMLMPHKRVNRSLRNDDTILKGKWIVDLRNFVPCSGVDEIIVAAYGYMKSRTDIFSEPACYGDYWGELIGLGGETRTRAYRDADYAATR